MTYGEVAYEAMRRAYPEFGFPAWANTRAQGRAIYAEIVAAVISEFVRRVDARAEADMLAGNPLTGAHFRAMRVELAEATPATGTDGGA